MEGRDEWAGRLFWPFSPIMTFVTALVVAAVGVSLSLHWLKEKIFKVKEENLEEESK